MFGGKSQGSQAPTAFGSLLQASTYGMTIPVPYGRVQSNLLAIWANNLREGGSGKKGKSGKKGVTTYVERIDFLLGKNPIQGVLQLWNNGTKYPLVDTVYSTTVTTGGAAAITIPDSHFYAVIGVTLTQSYSATFNDYGASGSSTASGSYEVPLWNELFAGPDPTDSSSPRNWPFCYRWQPSYGATIYLDALPTGSLPGGTLKIYYVQLSSATKYSPPVSKNRLSFEAILGSGDEYDGYDSEQILYPWYAGMGSPNIDLGSSGSIPALKAELQAKWGLYSSGDCDYVDIIEDVVKSGITQMAMGSAWGQTEHGVGQYTFPGAIQKRFGRSTSGDCPALAYNMPNVAGNVLVVVATGSAALSIASSNGETWTPIVEGGTAYNAWYTTAAGGANTISVTGSGAGGEVSIYEIGGTGTVDAIAAGVIGQARNAFGSVTLTGHGLGGAGGSLIWDKFTLIGKLPKDAVITRIYAVLGTKSGGVISCGQNVAFGTTQWYEPVYSAWLLFNCDLGTDLSLLDTFGAGLWAADGGAPGADVPPSVTTLDGLGVAVYYTSATAPSGIDPLTKPVTPNAGEYVAWALPKRAKGSPIGNGSGSTRAMPAYVKASSDSSAISVFASSNGLIAFGVDAPLGKGTAQSTVQSGYNGYVLAIPFYTSTAAETGVETPQWDLLSRQNVHGNAPATFQAYGRVVRNAGDFAFAVPGQAPTALALITLKSATPPSNARANGTFLDADSLELTRAQCRANGLWGSLVMNSQQAASDWLGNLLEAADAVAVMSGHRMKILPRSEVSAAGNGAIYIAPTASGPVADLDVDAGDFVVRPKMVRKARTDIYTVLQLQHINRSSDYQQVTTTDPDPAGIAIYGVRKKDATTNNAVQAVSVARSVLRVQTRRQNYIDPASWKFTLNARWQRLDNWDLITITDRQQGIVKVPVRLSSIEEDDKLELACEAEPFIYGAHAPQELAATGSSPYSPSSSTNQTAGDVNAPLIFEPVPRLYGSVNQAQLWLVVSSSATNYGGAQVYISTDGGASYNAAGDPLAGSATTGLSTADWPAATDPDTTHDLALDLTESLGLLDSYAVTDEDNFLYPCIIAGGGSSSIPYELMTYAVATMTAANKYTLKATGSGNKLRRAVYNAPAASGAGCDHPSGSRWAFLSPTGTGILKLPLDATWIGKTLHFKICSFNSFGAAAQSLSDVTDYTYTPTGIANSGNTGQSFQVNGQ